MGNYVISSPSIFHHKNQKVIFENLFKNKYKETINVEGSFYLFNINEKEYTFILSKKHKVVNLFVKGNYTDHSFQSKDVVFSCYFNLICGAEYNDIELTDEIKELAEFYTPSYFKNNPHSALDNYANFDKEAFIDYCSLLNDEENNDFSGNQMKELYFEEYDSVKENIVFQFNDLYETLSSNKKFNKKSRMIEEGLFIQIDNNLIEIRDSGINLINFDGNKLSFYYVYLDDYFKGFTEEEYEDNNTIFFNQEDFLTRMDQVMEKIKDYECGYISSDSSSIDINHVFHLLSSLESTKTYLFTKYKIVNENKKVSPNELINPFHTLLVSGDFKWYNGELYNPNKILNKKHIFEYEDTVDFKYALICSSPLLTSYKKLTNEWKKIVQDCLDYSENTLIQEGMEHKDLAEIGLKELVKYSDKNL